ncbi:MAG: hypothetical protein WDN27_03070 [Candidatus Saccharibacteria bacterium]
MLLYAFNAEDEVAPAQVLNTFAKANPTLEFVGGITAEGKFIAASEVKALADLPSKPQLIAQVVATLLSPVNDVTNAPFRQPARTARRRRSESRSLKAARIPNVEVSNYRYGNKSGIREFYNSIT